MSQPLRTGFTTGTCAAAAAKAALLAWQGQQPQTVGVFTPQGRVLTIAVAAAAADAAGGYGEVIKDAGDDPDITHGCKVTARVAVLPHPGVEIAAGEGVGIVTKPGLAVPPGQPAVNPGPRQMIVRAVEEVLSPGQGALVTVSIPGGAELARRTLNPVLGIEGGLSILGTTGIVEPMSEEAFKKSLTPQIDVVQALGYGSIVFVPGRIGQDIAVNRCGLPPSMVVQTSNFIGHMLEHAADRGMRQVLIIGHLGKVVKIAAGIFHTHNRVADARLETMGAYAAAAGASQQAVQAILACATTEAAMIIIKEQNIEHVYSTLAARASERAERYVFGALTVGTVIATLQGEIVGLDENARAIGGSLQWKIP